MSMETLTIIEIIQIFIAYGFAVLFLPYIVFYKYLKRKPLFKKFIICIIVSNFYIINVVFAIFTLHIPGRISLYLFTILPAVFTWYRVNKPPVIEFFKLIYTSITRLFLGEAHIRTLAVFLFSNPAKKLKSLAKRTILHLFSHCLEWISLLALMGYCLWYNGYAIATKYSYGASDLVVHHFWVNEMNKGNIFCKGIYPFGFHNVIYFINNFFGIDTLDIFRVFGTVQTFYIVLMIYILLKSIFKSRFIPIIGVFIFVVPDIFEIMGTMRFQFALPQEFGMIFLYPSAYFLIQFFKRKKREIRIETKLKSKHKLYTWMELYEFKRSTRSLVLFTMSFSLTLAVHFYITIFAIFLCLAVAIAYFPIVLNKRYFFSIALAGILSISIAVLPLAIAFIGGTPLQGSLEWALDVMSSKRSTGDVDVNLKQGEKVINSGDNFVVIDATESKKYTSSTQNSTAITHKNTDTSIKRKIEKKIVSAKKMVQKINNKFKTQCADIYNSQKYFSLFLLVLEGFFLLLLVLIIIRRKFYYRNLLAIIIYMFFMLLMFSAKAFSLPALMEKERIKIFVIYATPLAACSVLDFIYAIIGKPFRYHFTTEILPVGLSVGLLYLTITSNCIRPLNKMYAIMSPGEMQCNYQIMRDYPEKSYTIVTTTSSLQMIEDKGWHTELATFLKDMRYYDNSTSVTIPTKYVFFYIEKYPLAFGIADSVTKDLINMGPVSIELAKEKPSYSGSDVYAMDNRDILESKMFYWAKAFEKKYPQEFQVYYEDESFICYRIIQNEYNLYNFAIDYGYNN